MKPVQFPFQAGFYLTPVSSFSFSYFEVGMFFEDGFQESWHTQRVPEFASDINWKFICSQYSILAISIKHL